MTFYMVYIVFLWTYTQIDGKSPYPVFTFDSAIAWVMAVFLLPSTIIAYLCLFGLTFLKFKCVKDGTKAMKESENVELQDLDTGLPTHDVSLNTEQSPDKIEMVKNKSRLVGVDSQI